MIIRLDSDSSLTVEDSSGPLTVEADKESRQYSPFHMLASGLGICTYSVLASWAANAALELSSLRIEVAWEFAEKPHRVGKIALKIHWPSLPQARHSAALRVAALCPIHHTLVQPPAIGIELA